MAPPKAVKHVLLITILGALAACKPVGVADQAKLSQPIFEFDGSGPRSYDCGLTSQLETGRASTSNVAAGGCASCR